MIATMSIRDLARNGSVLSKYDYIEVKNQKSKTYKGIFISKKYAKEMKKILDKKIANEKRKKNAEINQIKRMLQGKIGEDKVGDIKNKYGR